jgi:hypothetical protein
MRIEHGLFDRPADQLFDRAQARVIVEPADFERLELRDHESGSQLSPCLLWCHRNIGRGYSRWEMVSAAEGDIFYFIHAEHAEKFFATFNNNASASEGGLMLAA